MANCFDSSRFLSEDLFVERWEVACLFRCSLFPNTLALSQTFGRGTSISSRESNSTTFRYLGMRGFQGYVIVIRFGTAYAEVHCPYVCYWTSF